MPSSEYNLGYMTSGSADCSVEYDAMKDNHYMGEIQDGFSPFLWFFVIFILTLIILFTANPTWVQMENPITRRDERNFGLVFLWSLVISIIIIAIVYLFRMFTRRGYTESE